MTRRYTMDKCKGHKKGGMGGKGKGGKKSGKGK